MAELAIPGSFRSVAENFDASKLISDLMFARAVAMAGEAATGACLGCWDFNPLSSS
jgi:hypothetical protein